MSNNKVIEIKNPELKNNDLLTDLIRNSAKEMLARAIEAELEEFLGSVEMDLEYSCAHLPS